MEIVDCTRDEAAAFVREHHRHNDAPVGWRFGCALVREFGDDDFIGVAMAGNPKSRVLASRPGTLEVTRVCTLGERNANSMLYGAIARAATALGFRTLYTYTLAEESGSSLLAAGWLRDAELPARESWNTPSRLRHQEKRPTGPKVRWVKHCRPTQIADAGGSQTRGPRGRSAQPDGGNPNLDPEIGDPS